MYGPSARLSTLAVAGALYVATSAATTQPATPSPTATPTQPATVTQPATPSPTTTTSAPATTTATTTTPSPTESLLPNRPRDGAGPVRRGPDTGGPGSAGAAGGGMADHTRSSWSSLLPAPQTGLKIFAAGLLALAVSIGGLAAMAIRRRTP